MCSGVKMNGRSAIRLISDCLTPQVNTCEPFRTCSVHILHSTNKSYYKNRFFNGLWNNACGCQKTTYYNNRTTTTPEPQWIDVPYGSSLPFPKLRGPSGYIYGLTPHEQTTRVINGYVKSAELEPWRQKRIVPYFNPPPEPPNEDQPRVYRSGPSLKTGHACYAIKRRSITQPEYENYLDWYFTDPHPNWEVDREVACCHDDWLGYTYPAKWIWHNKGIEQPFKAWSYFEDCGIDPGQVNPQCMNVMEFCEPLNIYNTVGSVIGQYVGYTNMIFFNNNTYMCGNDYVNDHGLPLDPTGDYPQPKSNGKVFRYQDAMSIDVHYYLKVVAPVGIDLKSPRIGSIRFWRPHTDFGSGYGSYGPSCCRPYLYWWCGGYQNNWWINCEFNLYEGGTEVIPMGLSTPNVYMVA